MFFSNDLLSRRDSGFGLLWLAATLGAKSTFKKLPKRSVITADISQLCEMIKEPSEPLALRLSSNLMFGVVRVYKVKQEFLMTDVQTCFVAIKKAVQDIHSAMEGSNAQLQMPHPTARAEALTLFHEPGASFSLDIDQLLPNWDDILPPRDPSVDPDDGEYGAPSRRGKAVKARAAKPRSTSYAEQGRAAPHTLEEHDHDFLLSQALDASLASDRAGGLPSSSAFGGALDLAFDDGAFAPGELGALEGMDELARELGWDAGDDRPEEERMDADLPMEMDAPADMAFDLGPDGGMPPPATPLSEASRKRPPQDSDKENVAPQPSVGSERPSAEPEVVPPPRKRARRAKLQVDARIELSDEELRAARENYLRGQDALRREAERKKAEKEGARMAEEMVWGVPLGFHALGLTEFWTTQVKGQVEARSLALTINARGDRVPVDRRRTATVIPRAETPRGILEDQHFNMDPPEFGPVGEFEAEEPELGRDLSRPPSALGSFRGQFAASTPVHQSLGWDVPGPSSSVGGGAGFDARLSFEPADLQLSGAHGRRSSVLGGSVRGSGAGMSPAPTELGLPDTQLLADDFGFALPGTQSAVDSQQSDANLAALERNSLEHAKAKLRSIPVAGSLTFEEIVPQDISTAHVASSVFYHCLVLATKNLVTVEQPDAYGPMWFTKKAAAF